MRNESAVQLAELVRWTHQRGWVPGTGGNFSCLLSRDPFRLLVTPSGVEKGLVTENSFLLVDEDGTRLEGTGKPSAETLLHIAILQRTDSEVVAHTHSIWNTLTSLVPGDNVVLSDVEMLKGLSGVSTHEHEEIVPILENSQDIAKLSGDLAERLKQSPTPHAVLLRGHGLYTWGHNMFEVRRHVEVFEFLFELYMRARQMELKWHI
ncbi:MAG: methylthioribulose 1-phosphate dehydratase [Fimbriimonadales bacterium]